MDWKKLSILGKKPLFLPSMIILSLTPIGASVLYELNVAYFVSPSESKGLYIPRNILFVYCSSLALFIGSIVFSLACPNVIAHYTTYKDWRENSPEASAEFQLLLKNKGECNIDHIEITLISIFHKLIEEGSNDSPFLRWVVSFFYCVGVSFFILVLLDQVLTVFNIVF